jgi:hypothetical protein
MLLTNMLTNFYLKIKPSFFLTLCHDTFFKPMYHNLSVKLLFQHNYNF